MANTVGTLNLLQSIVDHGLELEKFDTAGTSEEYGNVRESVAHHHDFDEEGSLILHERSPINPKSIYATAKVAADFLTMNYHDAYGVPGVVTRMFNNYGPRQNPRYVTGTIITQALEREHDRARRARAAARLLLLHRRRPRAPDGRRAGHPRRPLRLRPGQEHLDGGLGRPDPPRSARRTATGRDREIVTTPARFRPGSSDVMALRVGYEKLNRETGWEPLVSWEEGIRKTIAWYAENRDRWIGRVDWLPYSRRAAGKTGVRILVTGGGGFLGSHLVERLRADGHRARRRAQPRLRPHALGGRRAALRRRAARARAPPRGRGRRDRREPREPRPLLVREPVMGAHVLEQSRLHGVDKLVVLGTVCAYPKFAPVPFREDDLWNGYPEETNAPYGVAKKALLVGAQAYREQYGLQRDLPAAREPLRAGRQLRPRDLARDPGADPQDARGAGARRDEVVLWGDGSPTREFLYVEDCAEGDRARRRALRRRRAGQPRHRRRDLDPRPRRARSPSSTGSTARSSGTRRSRTASRGASSTRPAPRSCSASRRARRFREGLERTVAWYREHASAYAGR